MLCVETTRTGCEVIIPHNFYKLKIESPEVLTNLNTKLTLNIVGTLSPPNSLYIVDLFVVIRLYSRPSESEFRFIRFIRPSNLPTG